ncbi:hypothetical protein Ab1vBOLIVR5_gp248 [Agrobacterium phage OLIVR5]|uniref:Uncharacterized protein n=1 Tax=Agrobacterium phage OLIVR5 TaxID=2723773 RepID=A0A858MT60_9CAUD|nr:hypothetical protein KNU99_gp153 [Agrobacterium phage OLIVR5]QIW87896.1 hypothetical protein Ab1vBOLIVR5_gp248 [Agrobacterium phage OLIVR5]QIW88161.1 hypothetical protein Ab1vBOLIVR6_gp254 [Agrobacterium phage OLIVR6]
MIDVREIFNENQELVLTRSEFISFVSCVIVILASVHVITKIFGV